MYQENGKLTVANVLDLAREAAEEGNIDTLQNMVDQLTATTVRMKEAVDACLGDMMAQTECLKEVMIEQREELEKDPSFSNSLP